MGNIVKNAPNWSDWVGVMVTTHFGLVLGLLWAPRGPKGPQKGPFWPEMPLLVALEVLGGPPGARYGPNCCQLVRLG